MGLCTLYVLREVHAYQSHPIHYPLLHPCPTINRHRIRIHPLNLYFSDILHSVLLLTLPPCQ